MLNMMRSASMKIRLCVQAGVMQTHDEETRKFFKHSSVTCVLAPRYASSKLSIFKQQAGFISFSTFCNPFHTVLNSNKELPVGISNRIGELFHDCHILISFTFLHSA